MRTFRVRDNFYPRVTTHRKPFDSVLDTAEETPFIRVHTSPDEVSIYAKLESFDPGANVKGRIGKYMPERMLESGEPPGGGTIVEPTAGNTDIGFAVTAGRLGIRTVFVIPEQFSVEKQTLMCALGADVMNTPTGDKVGGAIDRAHRLADELDDVVIPQQSSSPPNPEAHHETAAPEVYDAFGGEVGALVADCDTTGTLIGVARYGRKRNEDTFITAVEPEGSLYAWLHDRDVAETSYKTEDIGAHDPATNELFDPELVDEFVQIADRDTHGETQRPAVEENHLVVSSVAANSLAAIDVAERAVAGDLNLPHDTMATVLPGSSERYLSKDAYDDFKSWEG